MSFCKFLGCGHLEVARTAVILSTAISVARARLNVAIRWDVFGVVGVVLLFASSALAPVAKAASPRDTSTFDAKLTQIGVRLFGVDSAVISQYQDAFREEGVGEGLASKLFVDAITVLELAVERNDHNLQARFYLAKSYFAKSSQGEGRWSDSTLERARHHFMLVILNRTKGVSAERIRAESPRALSDIEKIQKGQGELVP